MSRGVSAAACPSRLRLMALAAGEPAGALAAHLAACARCGAIVREHAEARQALLGDDPVAASRLAARRIVAEVRATRASRWSAWLLAGVLVPATAAMTLFAFRPRQALVTPALESDGVRAKGDFALEVFCKRGDEVFALVDAAPARAGDQLRFAYSAAKAGVLLIFGVDDRGEIFPYYPEAALTGQPARAGGHLMLPGSIELDAHQGWERLFALWSDRPLEDAVVRAAVARGLARVREAGQDLRQMVRLDIDVEAQTTLLLRRP